MKSNFILGILIVVIINSCGTPAAVSSKTISTAPEVKSKLEATAKETKKVAKSLVMTQELAEGKDLFENNCGKCHRLYEASEFTKQDWIPILVAMQKKAHLNDAEMARISGYIEAQL